MRQIVAVIGILWAAVNLIVAGFFLVSSFTATTAAKEGILAQLPRAGAPPVFASYATWEAWVERLVELGVLEDHTRIWWDARPHPRLGTLEIRIADQPTSLARTALLVGLVRDLVEHAPGRVTDRGHYEHNRWAAARAGLDAELVHPDGGRVAPARELARELLGAEPPAPEALTQLAAADVAADIVARTVA